MKLYDLVNEVTLQGYKITIAKIDFSKGVAEVVPIHEFKNELNWIPDSFDNMEVCYIYPDNGNLVIEVTEV